MGGHPFLSIQSKARLPFVGCKLTQTHQLRHRFPIRSSNKFRCGNRGSGLPKLNTFESVFLHTLQWLQEKERKL